MITFLIHEALDQFGTVYIHRAELGRRVYGHEPHCSIPSQLWLTYTAYSCIHIHLGPAVSCGLASQTVNRHNKICLVSYKLYYN